MAFNGFSGEMLRFLAGLKENNSKEWFDSYRGDYEKYIMEPSREFVVDMGERLREVVPEIVAVPRVNQSLFRLNRDTRFSKNKSPYKTNIGIFFWEGSGPRMENPGFYFHVEHNSLMVGGGMHTFSKPFLERYRNAVANDVLGPLLEKAIGEVESAGFEVGRKTYKQVPRGYDRNHVRAELLLFGGLTAADDGTVPNEFYSVKLLDYCLERFEGMLPLHRWLVRVMSVL